MFNSIISFDLTQAAPVALEIYDVTGRRMCILLNHPFPAGSHHSVKLDGLDLNSHPVASRLYIYRIHAGDFVPSRKMLFMK